MVVDYLAAGREDDRFDWNVPAGLSPRLSGDLHQSPAAGDFHDEHGQRIDFRSIDHFRQFADVGLRVKDRNDKFVCLMDLALLAMKRLKAEGKLDDQEESDEINACSRM